MKTASRIVVVIPARYGSTRFPGKPLAKLAGKTMLQRVVENARATGADVFVTTEDERIAAHAGELGVACILTPADCPTGSDRVLTAYDEIGKSYDVIINLQGDAPFITPEIIKAVIDQFTNNHGLEVVTPIHHLTWEELDQLHANKKTTPFSGTTVIVNDQGRALWFSKNIIPAIRQQTRTEKYSPVYQHIGLYAYQPEALKKFCALPQSNYERLEGLEQLRMIENGIAIQTVLINAPVIHSGIDTPEDLQRAEKYFQ